jgi:histidinol phosphatase-like PHP family hydrolase
MARARAVLAKDPRLACGPQGDLQVHTTWSDGREDLETMADAARGKGYRYVAITDHSKGLPIANGMDEARLALQTEAIDARNAAAPDGFRVVKSLEMNLSPEGEGDMDPEALARLDLVLGAFHSKLRRTEDQTERYVAALRNPTFHVLAHPRCRIYDHRLGLSADWDRVFAVAAETGKAVEIDAYPDRQDLDVALLRRARAAGCRISIGTDAHSVPDLDAMPIALAAATLARIPAERIVGFQPVEGLLAWARSLRR